ncbi:MAG TPA: hypothetical protein VJ912_00190 [Candidatus Nanoarchaeia archaeon]|nr:hypothetical protein [Candidatus Nanoarchaeia archaeon]
MNKEEAIKVLQIMTSADGGCSGCAGELMAIFVRIFGFKKEAEEIFKETFGEDLSEREDLEGEKEK